MVEPVAVAIHAVNRASFCNGDTIAVIGAGPIGLLTLQAAKAAGAGKVICLDVLDERLGMAKELGADEIINVSDGNIPAEIADVVFETAGSSKATESIYTLSRPGGVAVQVGWPEKNKVAMDIAQFIEKELNYVGVNRYANAYPAAIKWVSDGRINVEKLITHRFNFEQIAEAFEFTATNKKDVIKTIVLN
ncbi:MAG TPA: zinc-binding dehydrogenase [Thermoclostridium sp.]